MSPLFVSDPCYGTGLLASSQAGLAVAARRTDAPPPALFLPLKRRTRGQWGASEAPSIANYDLNSIGLSHYSPYRIHRGPLHFRDRENILPGHVRRQSRHRSSVVLHAGGGV